MMVEWLVYALVVSALVSASAWLADRGARARGWPTRWVWVGALGISLAIPLLAWLLPPSASTRPAVVAVPAALVMESLQPMGMAGPASGPSVSMLAVAAWAAMTAVLLVLLGVLSALLRLRRRQWRGCSVDGVDVLVSRDTGPAAFGLWRGRVVVPEWALALERGQRQLLVLHEAEHVRAGDPRVAFTALLMCCLVPWNLPLWLQLRRLRLALELDCDARVLRRAGDARGYGSLLLKVGQRRAGLALALAEPRSMLERRIRMITGTRSKGTVRAAALAGAAGLVLAMACEAPGPTDSAAERTSPDPVAPRLSNADGPCEPVVYRNATPSELAELDEANIENIHVLKPGVDGDAGEACGAIVVRTKDASPEDEAATRRLLERLGVPSLRPGQAGIRLEAQGDREGGLRIRETSSDASTGETPPAAASSAAERARGLLREAGEVRNVRERGPDEPTFTPMTERPRLRNAEEAARLLQELYPPLLRDAGIGGTANIWFYIDETGRVADARVNESSGYQALDAAALRAAERMEFTPARNGDRQVPVWVALDMTFEVD